MCISIPRAVRVCEIYIYIYIYERILRWSCYSNGPMIYKWTVAKKYFKKINLNVLKIIKCQLWAYDITLQLPFLKKITHIFFLFKFGTPTQQHNQNPSQLCNKQRFSQQTKVGMNMHLYILPSVDLASSCVCWTLIRQFTKSVDWEDENGT